MRKPQLWIRIGTVSCAALVACFVAAAKAFDASSLTSDYAPSGRVWGKVTVADSIVTVRIDSLLVAVPGFTSPVAPPAVGQLTLRVLVAVADEQKWRPIAESDPVSLLDTLRTGEQAVVRRLTFRVNTPRSVQLNEAFLVFEFRGRALQRPELGESIRTYVCSGDNLGASSASARARAALLASAYMRAC